MRRTWYEPEVSESLPPLAAEAAAALWPGWACSSGKLMGASGPL